MSQNLETNSFLTVLSEEEQHLLSQLPIPTNFRHLSPFVALAEYYYDKDNIERACFLARYTSENGNTRNNLFLGKYYRKKNKYCLSKIYYERVNYITDARMTLAKFYERGLGVPQSYEMALSYYKKIAQKGIACGIVNVGRYIEEGLCEFADMSEADRYSAAFSRYMIGIENNQITAISRIGGLYEKKGDYPAANEWYSKLLNTEKNRRPGYYDKIGNLCEIGQYYDEDGVRQPASMKQALEFYREGATYGCKICLYKIGMFFLNGIEVPQDLEKAKDFLIVAAQKEHIPARDILLTMGIQYKMFFGIQRQELLPIAEHLAIDGVEHYAEHLVESYAENAVSNIIGNLF